MKTKIDNIYTEISTKFENGENFNEYQSQIDAEIIAIDKDIEIKNSIQKSKKAQADRLLENASNEGNEEKKNNAVQQVLNIRREIVKLNQEKQQLAKEKQQLEIRKQNYLGYSKNRTEIEKIKDYKKTLENKAKSVKNELEAAKSRYEFLNDILEKEKKEFEEAEKKLNDAKKEMESVSKISVNADAAEQKAFYENIEIKQGAVKIAETLYEGSKKSFEQKQKEVEDLKAKVEKYSSEYETISGMIGKCDLAWKTLFTNKGWDEIHRRSLENGKKYTKINSDKDAKKEPNKENKDNKEAEKPAEKPAVESTGVNRIAKTEEKALTEIKQTGFFSRVATFFRNAYNNVKSYFSGNSIVTDEEVEKIEAMKKEKMIAEREEIEKQRKAEIERIKAQKEAAKANQKDAFIEALRIKVDDEYAEQHNAKKTNDYKARKQAELEANKAKNEKQPEPEKGEER